MTLNRHLRCFLKVGVSTLDIVGFGYTLEEFNEHCIIYTLYLQMLCKRYSPTTSHRLPAPPLHINLNVTYCSNFFIPIPCCQQFVKIAHKQERREGKEEMTR